MAYVVNKNALNIKNPTTGLFEQVPMFCGESAYQIAVRYGYIGTEKEWAELMSGVGTVAIAEKANSLNLVESVGDSSTPVYFTEDGLPVKIRFKLEKSVPSDAVFTDTWRPVVISLDSDDNNSALAASQGKVLKELINGKANSDHDHNGTYYSRTETDNLLNNKLDISLKGKANGLAELDESGRVPSSQLPSYVDDVMDGYYSGGKFYADSALKTEITGEGGKIYTNLLEETNNIYRWSGSKFVSITDAPIVLGETSSTAYRGDRGKIAYDHSQTAHARTDATKTAKSNTNGNLLIDGTEVNVYTHPSGTNPHKTTKTDVGLGNVPNVATDDQTVSFTEAETLATIISKEKISLAFGKIAKAINSLISHIKDSTIHVTSDDKTKLDGIDTNANNYTHPTTSGNKHIPSGGSSGQILRWSSDGTAVWGSDNNTTYSEASTTKSGLFSSTDKTKLDGITADADAVSFTRSLASGTKIGTININGTDTVLYAPTNTDTTYSNFVKSGTGANSGLVPAPPTTAGTTKYLREDGTWATPDSTVTISASYDADNECIILNSK